MFGEDVAQSAALADSPWLFPPLVLGLAAVSLALALPLDGSPSAAFGAQATWSFVHKLSTALTILAVLFGFIGFAGARNSAPVEGLSSRSKTFLIAAACLAGLGLRLRELAVPSLSGGWSEPLRDSLAGITPTLATGVALAGLFAVQLRPNSASARSLTAVGAVASFLQVWTPTTWLGEVRLPVIAALTGLHMVPNGPIVALPGSLFVLAQALAATLLILWLVFDADLSRRIATSFAVALILPLLLWPLHGTQPLSLSLQTVGTALIIAGALLPLAVRDNDSALRSLAIRWESFAVALMIAAFLLLKLNGVRYSTTDEAIYFYAAKMWSQGLWPYTDFFFSHPPLHIAVPAALYKIFGYSFGLSKWLSALAALGAGIAVWRIARKHIGIWAGPVALGLYLFACEVLQASTNLTGINLTTCWMMWGFWAVLSQRFVLGGLLLGAAASTGFYAIGAFLTLAVLALFHPDPLPKTLRVSATYRLWQLPFIRLCVGFLAVWGVLNLYFYLAAGDLFIDGAYGYHFAKKAKIEGFTPLSEGPQAVLLNLALLLRGVFDADAPKNDFTVTLYYHAAHYWLAALAPVGLAWGVWLQGVQTRMNSRDQQRLPAGTDGSILWNPRTWWQRLDDLGAQAIAIVLAAALLTEFAQFKERYDFYYALLMPLLAINAMIWLGNLAKIFQLIVQAPVRKLPLPRGLRWSALAGLSAILLWVPVDMYANHKAFKSEFVATADGSGVGEVLRFEWVDAPGPAWLSELTRAVFWQDTRTRGNVESGIHHYLWNKKRYFSTAEAIAAYIDGHSGPEATISGASDYAPLIALLANRRLAGNQVDTNTKVFDTGAVQLEQFWDKACADHLQWLVVAPQSYFAAPTLNKRATIIANFERAEVFHDAKLKHWKDLEIELWRLKPGLTTCRYAGKRGVGPTLQN